MPGASATPVGLLLLLYLLLLESGRIPVDLVEAESELVSGFNTEYAGMYYALLATAEYAHMLFSVLCALLLVGCMSHAAFAAGFLVWFMLYMVVRSTLPRYRWSELLHNAVRSV